MERTMKILITGAHGMLAYDVIRELESSFEIYTGDLPQFDICDKEKVTHEIAQIKPDFVINCAGYTNVDGCETEQELAFAVNADGVQNIAQACKETGCILYHISTDFVFDGKKEIPYIETDDVNPLSTYARTKLEGERHVQAILEKYVIVRTSWLFGEGGKNFVTTIRKLSEENDKIRIVHDQIGSPTYAVDLARAIKALLHNPAQGIYHVCNSGKCTWYEFAVKIVELLGHKTVVVPITSQELARPAVRPRFSVMDCGKLISETGFHLRSWEDALEDFLTGTQGT